MKMKMKAYKEKRKKFCAAVISNYKFTDGFRINFTIFIEINNKINDYIYH